MMTTEGGAPVSFEAIGDAQDVDQVNSRGQGLRLGLSLVVAGLVIGAMVAVGVGIVGGFAQTEAGLCRITWAPCSELSLGSVEALSGLDLPEGTEVVSGSSRESTRFPEFRAEVVLPDGALFSLSTDYSQLDEARPDLVPAVDASHLSAVRYWSAFEQAGDSTASAAQGVDERGRTVILFDTRGLE